MSVPNFSTLLADALNGKREALTQWHAHTLANSFNEEEINEALQKIEALSSIINSPQKSHALNLRAFMHQYGLGGPKNEVEAVRLYEQAIALDNTPAMHNRAYMHEEGLGGPKNDAKAVCLYEQAIALNDSDAMNNRAYMHEEGLGGPKNEVEAVRLYERAIALGNTTAMNNRAGMYLEGVGGPKNEAKAVRLYEQAIALGDADAKISLAELVEKQQKEQLNKKEVANEYEEVEAVRLYEQAIALGDADAKISLAELVEKQQKEQLNKKEVANEYENVISPFHNELSKLEAKAKILRKNGHKEAYKSAMKIHSTLTQAHTTLQKDGNLQAFNQTCTDIITTQRSILDSHRGWSEFLSNLVIATTTLGIGLLIKGTINWGQNKSFFFVHKTESGKIVDEIQNKLDPSHPSHGVK